MAPIQQPKEGYDYLNRNCLGLMKKTLVLVCPPCKELLQSF